MKISVLSLLLIAALFGLMLLIGCDEGMQMMKPTMEKPVPPEMEPPIDPEGSVGLTKEEAWEKADGILIRTVDRLEKELGEQGWLSDLDAASLRNRIVFEETDLEWEQIIALLKIYLEEDPHSVKIYLKDSDSIEWKLAWGNITVHYLSDTFLYPTKTEDEILEMFREKCRNGGTTAIWDDVKETHFSDRLIDHSSYLTHWPYVFIFADTPLYEARWKAHDIVTGPSERIIEALTKYIQRDVWEPHFRNTLLFSEAENKIILEETGLAPELVDNLIQIHLDNNPNTESSYFEEISQNFKANSNLEGNFTLISDVVAKYLELTFIYSTKTESEIMDMFTEVVKAGNTSVLFFEVKVTGEDGSTVHFLKEALEKYYPGLYDSIYESESTMLRESGWIEELIEEVENEFEELQNE